MPTKVQVQLELEDTFIEDPTLETLLEAREEHNEMKRAASKLLKKATSAVTEHVIAGGVLIPEGERRRCGRFVLTTTHVDEAEIEFTRAARTGLSIAVAKNGK